MRKILPISEVKARLPELVSGVEKREDAIVVTRKGRAAAVLVSHAEYQRIQETLDVLSDPGVMEQIRKSRAHFEAGAEGVAFEDLFGEPLFPKPARRR
jgi:prevent-host-death family protein